MIKKRRLTEKEFEKKRNAIHEIKHLMLKCYPDAGSKKTREQILAHVSDIFVSEFGNQKDAIRNQIIGRVFNQNDEQKMVLDINGVEAEFKILRHAKLSKVDGIPVEQLKSSSLPKYFNEGVMAALFKKEVEKRMRTGEMFKQPIIDITPRQRKKSTSNKFTSIFNAGWFKKISFF